jgi:Tol biopolymer transport system component
LLRLIVRLTLLLWLMLIFCIALGTLISPRAQFASLTRCPSHVGFSNIVLVDADRRLSVCLTHDSETRSRPFWSPDGEKLAYLSYEAINILTIASGHTQQIINRSTPIVSSNFSPHWSPDGQQILLMVRQTRDSEQLLLYDFRQQAFVPLPYGDALQVEWSPADPTTALVTTEQGVTLWRADQAPKPIGFGRAVWLPHGTGFLTLDGNQVTRWSADGETLKDYVLDDMLLSFALSPQGDHAVISFLAASQTYYILDFASGEQRVIPALPNPMTYMVSYSPDARWRLYVQSNPVLESTDNGRLTALTTLEGTVYSVWRPVQR